MPSLALTKEEIVQSLAMEIFDRDGAQADAHALSQIPLDGHWIPIGRKRVVEILRYHSDGTVRVQRNDRVEMVVRVQNDKCIAFVVGRLGFERCKVNVVYQD